MTKIFQFHFDDLQQLELYQSNLKMTQHFHRQLCWMLKGAVNERSQTAKRNAAEYNHQEISMLIQYFKSNRTVPNQVQRSNKNQITNRNRNQITMLEFIEFLLLMKPKSQCECVYFFQKTDLYIFINEYSQLQINVTSIHTNVNGV